MVASPTLISPLRYTGIVPLAADFLGIAYKAQRDEDGALLAVRYISAQDAEACGHSLSSLYDLYKMLSSSLLLTKSNLEADETGECLLTPLPPLYRCYLENNCLIVEQGLASTRSLSQYIRRHRNFSISFHESVLWKVASQLLKALVDLYAIGPKVSLGLLLSLGADTISVYAGFQLQLGFGLPYTSTAIGSSRPSADASYRSSAVTFLTTQDDVRRILQVLNAMSSLDLRASSEVQTYDKYSHQWSSFLARLGQAAVDPELKDISVLADEADAAAESKLQLYKETNALFREIKANNYAAIDTILQQNSHKTDFLETPNALGETALDLAAAHNNATIMALLCRFVRTHRCKVWMAPCRINSITPPSPGLVTLHAAAGCSDRTNVEVFGGHSRQVMGDNPFRTSLAAMLAGECHDNLELLLCEVGVFLNKHISHLSLCAMSSSSRGAGADWFIPEVGINGFTNLMLYAAIGDAGSVSHYLHEAKEQTTMGYTALMLAASNGHLACVDLLLMEARTTDNYGWTSLMMAADGGYADCVRSLLPYEKGIVRRGNMTPLMFAAQEGHVECVRLLLEDKDNLNAFTDAEYGGGEGINALVMAAWSGHLECVKLLKPYLGNSRNPAGQSPLDVLRASCASRTENLSEKVLAVQACIEYLFTE